MEAIACRAPLWTIAPIVPPSRPATPRLRGSRRLASPGRLRAFATHPEPAAGPARPSRPRPGGPVPHARAAGRGGRALDHRLGPPRAPEPRVGAALRRDDHDRPRRQHPVCVLVSPVSRPRPPPGRGPRPRGGGGRSSPAARNSRRAGRAPSTAWRPGSPGSGRARCGRGSPTPGDPNLGPPGPEPPGGAVSHAMRQSPRPGDGEPPGNPIRGQGRALRVAPGADHPGGGRGRDTGDTRTHTGC